jgi:hypothetical protein
MSMGNLLLDALSVLEAEIPQNTEPVATDLGYGSDLFCDGDATPDFAELSGDDPRNVTLALYRRVTTPRGALLDDAGYGDDVHRLLHTGMTPVERIAYADMLSSEALEDDRIDSCNVQISDAPEGGLQIRMRGELKDGKGSYSLTMVVGSGDTILAEMHAND